MVILDWGAWPLVIVVTALLLLGIIFHQINRGKW